MPIKKYGQKYIIEIQNRGKTEGVLCTEGFEVEVFDEGGGPFLAIRGRNLDPCDDYDSHTVTIDNRNGEIDNLCAALKDILKQAEIEK